MSEPEVQFAEAQHLTGLIFRVAERAKDDFAVAVAECGLSLTLARAVFILGEPAPMHEVADQLACDPSYITNLADQLEAHGLAERAAGTDRRVKLLQLTPEGLQMRERLSAALEAGATVTRALTAAQRADLGELLEQMLR